MASNPSKWRLNNVEKKECTEAGKDTEKAALAVGKTKRRRKPGTQPFSKKTTQLKTAKAERAANKEGPRQKLQAQIDAATVAAATPSQGVTTPANNMNYYAEVTAARNAILAHPLFKNIAVENPLNISDKVTAEKCGVQSVFSAAECLCALQAQGAYWAAVNLFWIDTMMSPTPLVPLSIDRTRAWGEQFFNKGPCHLRDNILISCPAPDFDMLACKGAWRVASPEEMLHSTMHAAWTSRRSTGFNDVTALIVSARSQLHKFLNTQLIACSNVILLSQTYITVGRRTSNNNDISLTRSGKVLDFSR
ncbi:hypothetical protein AK812_SmicGene1639 [Symbiodinium microadriaticum]|uniref:Uncharacterized protein n=1 Tax=Symbiodinium microadriaticum TaxID=2951 RepID=A0A1Q9F3G7_SYMMI|nr:hypothetical protein AK812_SmicGene1639 [Symbiodinium microadriaticum]